MARTHAVWSAPSLDSLTHDKIRLDCTAETLRAVWKAETLVELMPVLVDHFGGEKWGTVAEEQAEDFFHTTRMAPNGGLLHSVTHKRLMINNLAGFHGVEYLGVHRRSGKVVRYCKAGDTYAPTLCFMGRRMFVATMGDLIEKRTVRREDE